MAVDPEVEPLLICSSLSLCQLKGNGGFSCHCQQEATVWVAGGRESSLSCRNVLVVGQELSGRCPSPWQVSVGASFYLLDLTHDH